MKRYTIDAVYEEEDAQGEYVLYSEAQARIEALEWLVEVQDFAIYFDPSTRDSACIELAASWKYAELQVARAAAGV
jgi:hypothetical protein